MTDEERPDPDPDPSGQLTYNVARLLGEETGSQRTFTVAGVLLDLGADLTQSAPLEGSIVAVRAGRGLLVSGALTTSLAIACSRCLRPVEVAIEVDLEEDVSPSVDIATGAPVPAGTDPEALRLTSHHELVLGTTMRDLILLGEPIAPLCRPDCPGLCTVCGIELATGPHDHPEVEIDPRLAALAAFRPSRPS